MPAESSQASPHVTSGHKANAEAAPSIASAHMSRRDALGVLPSLFLFAAAAPSAPFLPWVAEPAAAASEAAKVDWSGLRNDIVALISDSKVCKGCSKT
jgi:hypothetical protein